MSYDLKLYRKDKSSKPFEEEEVKTKLSDSFEYLVVHPRDGFAIGFDVGYKAEDGGTEFYHQGEEKGYYWTYCSYGVDEQTFIDLKKLVKDVAEKLNLQIQDPQISNDMIDPATFNPSDPQSNKMFNLGKGSIQQFVEKSAWILPAKSKHFILYFVISNDPITNKKVLLTLGGDKMYASKVESEESIEQVVKREIPELTGADEYKIMQVQKHDTAKDRHGNELPRYAVFVEVPYFTPEARALKQRVEWKTL